MVQRRADSRGSRKSSAKRSPEARRRNEESSERAEES